MFYVQHIVICDKTVQLFKNNKQIQFDNKLRTQ